MRLRFLLTGAALIAGSNLRAVEPEALPSAFECNAPSGYYDDIARAQPGPSYRLAGRVAALAFFSDREWYPVATAKVRDGRGKEAIAIRLRRLRANAPIELVVQTKVKGKEREAVIATVRKGEFAPFAIEVAGGSVRVEVGGRKFVNKTRIGPGATVQIACSTGKFTFDSLEWTPRAPAM